ncbi:MAG: phosphoribosylanthranilate isomerase [Clostridium sp.]|nr:phosphoribosylanthranilate isomerase [Clostridium sp.]
MKPFIIKVCGMRETDNIRDVEKLRPQWMGFICTPDSPRYIGTQPPAYLPASCSRVAVFVNPSPEQLTLHVHQLSPDIIQLHGSESPEECHWLRTVAEKAVGRPMKIIKAFGIGTDGLLPSTEPYEDVCDYLLFDTRCPMAGGSGKRFPWNALEAYHGKLPFLLSGGIGPDNLTALHCFRHPMWAGIDLNSRFELLPALKDVRCLENFIKQIHQEYSCNIQL